ncbi:MAG: hypothetical protein AB1750_15570 [Chloroflexota bacterium]
MSFEIDEKGKVFTEVVSKISVPALVQTTTHLIRGQVHIRPEERLKNELDRDELFLAVTDASILDPDGRELFRSKFLAVRRSQIVWAMPDEEAKGGGTTK